MPVIRYRNDKRFYVWKGDRFVQLELWPGNMEVLFSWYRAERKKVVLDEEDKDKSPKEE